MDKTFGFVANASRTHRELVASVESSRVETPSTRFASRRVSPYARLATRLSPRRLSPYARLATRLSLRSPHLASRHSFPSRSIRASATAMRAPTAALFLTSATLASRLAPPVSVRTRSNRNGVTSRPRTPSLSASSNAVSMAAWTADPAASCSDGMGTPNTHPPSPRFRFARTIAAASSGASTLAGAAHPDVLEKRGELVRAVPDHRRALRLEHLQRARNVEDGFGTGADDRDGGSSEFREVRGDVEGVLASAMDAADAAGDEHLDAGAVREEHGGGDGGGSRGALSDDGGDVAADTLAARAPASARARRWLSSRPTVGTPSIMATVAGTAPLARTTDSTSRAISRFRGYGIPWETIVLSSATTARPAARAAATSGWTTTASRPAEGVAEVTASRGEEALRWSAMDAARRAARPSIAREDVTACVGTRARSALCRRRGSGGPCRRAETSSGVQPTK